MRNGFRLPALVAMIAWTAASTAEPARFERIIEMDRGMISACGIRVTISDDEGHRVEARLDKSLAGGQMHTELSLTLFGLRENVLVPLAAGAIVTRTVDTAKLMTGSPAGKSYGASASLEDQGDGGMLFRELLVSGGEIIAVPTHGAPMRFAVGGPAPRDVTAGYLHCTGDLVGPSDGIRRDG